MDIKYWGSGIAIKNAYKKYGIENFSKEIDKTFETRDKANLYEAKIVNEEWVEDRTTYNMKTGGLNGRKYKHTEETKQKLRIAIYKRVITDEIRQNISKGRLGIKHTEETKQKLRDINIGKKLSEETKQKISEKTRGKNNPNFGKPMSLEQKNKISNTLTGKKQSKETKQKRINTQSLLWEVITPTNKVYVIKNLKEFCRNNNLDNSCMIKVAKGYRKQHKGWKCKKLD